MMNATMQHEFVALANNEGRSTAALVFFVNRWLLYCAEGDAKQTVSDLLAVTGLEASLLSPQNVSKLRKVASVFTGPNGAQNMTQLREALADAPSQTWRRMYAAITWLERNNMPVTYDTARRLVMDRAISTRELRGEEPAKEGVKEGVKDAGLSAIMSAVHAARGRVNDDVIIAALESLK